MADFQYNVKLGYTCDTCGVYSETYATRHTPLLSVLRCNRPECFGERRLTKYEAPIIEDEEPPTKLCAKDMGGIWLPDRFGIETFVPVKCNREAHDSGLCCYTDTKSGMVIHTGALFPSLEVDKRGCVVSTNKLNEPTDMLMQMEARELGPAGPIPLKKENYGLFDFLKNKSSDLIDRKIVDEMTPEMRCASLRFGFSNTLNAKAVAEHQAKICPCYTGNMVVRDMEPKEKCVWGRVHLSGDKVPTLADVDAHTQKRCACYTEIPVKVDGKEEPKYDRLADEAFSGILASFERQNNLDKVSKEPPAELIVDEELLVREPTSLGFWELVKDSFSFMESKTTKNRSLFRKSEDPKPIHRKEPITFENPPDFEIKIDSKYFR